MKEQAFAIMLVTQGAMNFDAVLDLEDEDREWLYERCMKHQEEMEKEAERLKRSARRGRR